jgi:hypothetical protein
MHTIPHTSTSLLLRLRCLHEQKNTIGTASSNTPAPPPTPAPTATFTAEPVPLPLATATTPAALPLVAVGITVVSTVPLLRALSGVGGPDIAVTRPSHGDTRARSHNAPSEVLPSPGIVPSADTDVGTPLLSTGGLGGVLGTSDAFTGDGYTHTRTGHSITHCVRCVRHMRHRRVRRLRTHVTRQTCSTTIIIRTLGEIDGAGVGALPEDVCMHTSNTQHYNHHTYIARCWWSRRRCTARGRLHAHVKHAALQPSYVHSAVLVEQASVHCLRTSACT